MGQSCGKNGRWKTSKEQMPSKWGGNEVRKTTNTNEGLCSERFEKTGS